MFLYSKRDNSFIRADYGLPRRVKGILSPTYNPFHVYNDTVNFRQRYNGDVFTLSEDGNLHPRYGWDFGPYNFELSLIPEDLPRDYHLRGLSNYVPINDYATYFLISIENTKYYMSRFQFKMENRHIILNKATGEHILFKEFIEGGQLIPMWMDEEAVYTAVSPELVSCVINPSVLDKENKQKYHQIKEDDNPVVIKYTFKN
jgi:hypothetical protein